VIAEIECLATPPGTPDNRYKHIEAAIKVIEESGLKYEVEPLGTTLEGEPDQVWAVLRAVHEACLTAGAESVVSVVKLYEARVNPSTMDSLTGKFR
jgi:uncharacterized protein (TIGR00106 family)